MNKIIIIFSVCFLLYSCSTIKNTAQKLQNQEVNFLIKDGLKVDQIGKLYSPDKNVVTAFLNKTDMGGSTSVRNVIKENLEWKPEGYFQRNRDIGQVFTPDNDFLMSSLVLRTGPSDKAVLNGSAGSKVFIQFFEVTGTPSINNNGTPEGIDAKHGYTKNHRADDYIQGVKYHTIQVIKGGVFPDIPATFGKDGPVNGNAGNLIYMRWKLVFPINFLAGKKYAFIIGFEDPGKDLGFTLANYNAASKKAAPSLGDSSDFYKGGWSIRREGNGVLPPTLLPGEKAPQNTNQLDKLIDDALFAKDLKRFGLVPTSDGYPDVDTYRDLEFAIESIIKAR